MAAEEGLYTVTVTNTDACDGIGTSSQVAIFVNESPVAAASTSIDVSQLTVQFINESTGASSYLWDFGDGNQSTEVNPLHTYLTGGDYDITLTAINGNCTDEFVFSILNVRVEETSSVAQFSLFPNPANDLVTIEYPGNSNGMVSVQVFDLTGKMVMNFIDSVIGSNSQLTIDVSELDNGVYLLSLIDGTNSGNVGRLIVRH